MISTLQKFQMTLRKLLNDLLISTIYPLMLSIRSELQNYDGVLQQDEISKLQDVYTLCSSQIKKCLHTLFDVFKTEYHQDIFLHETRQCTLERLTWCINRLKCLREKLNISKQGNPEEFCDDTMLISPMYFVNWIDHTFEVLSKLAEAIYKTDHKDNKDLFEQWKCDVVECVSTLHTSLDELLLSAMTLCKYCLPSDQLIVKARCQVVLRETKALLSELMDGDINSGIKLTPESLKLPIMPSNVNVLIDVLKDVLYVLETNTNTALLTLVVHCFSYSMSPVDMLKEHFYNTKGTCSCHVKSDDEVTADCSFVKDFDLYNERLLQIGSFAVSCSSDQNRILTLRSGLASLEALDPHLVPALMLSPDSLHARLLLDSWRQEVQEIRDSIFLIVDPAAFAEKSKQMMHQFILDLTKESGYDNARVCSIINIGCVVLKFFAVYEMYEPDALTHHEKLVPLLADLDKVQLECKIVSNLLSTGDDFVYDVKKSKNKEVSIDQLIKRLKLLYTLVSRLNSLLHPKDNEELFDCDAEDEVPIKNMTHTVLRKNGNTYDVHSPRKPSNISRSIFARTTNIRSSTNKFPLQKLTKHLKVKKGVELSFSVQLDELFDLSEVKSNNKTEVFANKHLESVREQSVLYKFSPQKRASLRKAVLSRRHKLPFDSELEGKRVEDVESSVRSEKGSLIDEATSLQITDILSQMTNLTHAFSKKSELADATYIHPKDDRFGQNRGANSNVLKIDINTNTTVMKRVWNIPVNVSMMEMPLDDSAGTAASNVTQPSNVTTLERINDIDLVETKLNSLKSMELETSL
ncbi:serendipity locus protein alpha-like isoform X2 [Pectinophora gossypiella]|uniref:serendipity locus protein alpha-like isoform X2 n=1 Tax=Pectinophora gossypiella TaxID=13191 RepID=UPI00214EF7AA|nr:serendipity locus protein alpha-like isoform X2 [Pectinophora gossypiella]